MAELVGLITGIGSIVATAFKISKMIVAIADELGTAGAQIRAIATETKAMALVLHNLKAMLKRDLRKINTEAKKVLKELIDLCASEMQNMDRHLMPLCGSGEGQRMDFKQKTMWLFAKTKISTTKASLDSMKLTLNLLLSTLEYMEVGDVEEIVEENIREMISTTKTTKNKILKAQRVDMAREIIYERSINRQQTPEGTRNNLPSPSSTLPEPVQVNLHMEHEANDEPISTSMCGDGNDDAHIAAMAQDPERKDMGENINDAHILAAAMNVPGLHDAIKQDSQLAVMAHHAEDRHQTHQDSHDFEQVNRITDWSLMRHLPDDSFLQIADHIRLQKTVSGFALDTMAETQKAEDICTTPEIDEPAPSGPGPSHRAPTVESEEEGQDSKQGPQLRSHISEEVPSRILGSLPPDDDSNANASQALIRKRSSSGTGSLHRWPGHPTRRDLYEAQGRMNDGDDSPSQPEQPQHPWGNQSSSPDFYMMPDHGAHERQKYQNPFPADINFGPYAPPPQGSGDGRFLYKSFGQSTGPVPQTSWGYSAGVANGPNYTLPRYNGDYRVPSPPSFTNGGRSSPKLEQPVSELVKVKAQLEALRLEREKEDQARERAETERKIREDAEREFKTRMEAMKEAQAEAHKEIELARIAAEQAARGKIEEELRAEEARQAELENLMIKAGMEARKNTEQEAMEKKKRQGFMKYFKRS